MKLHRVQSADALSTERLLLSTIVDSTDDAVVSVDVNGRVTSWNKGAERLYEIDAEDAMSAKFDEVLPSSAADLVKVLRGGEENFTSHREISRTLRNGKKILLDETVSALRNEAGKTVGAEKLWMGQTHVAPSTSSGDHHHGEAETAIYVVSGNPVFVFAEGDEEVRIETEPGDYVFVPPYVPHREENPGAAEAVVVIARSSQEGVVVNLPSLWAPSGRQG